MASATSFASQAWSSQADTKAPNWDAVFSMSAITPVMQRHIQKVYLTLAAALVLVGLGAYANVALQVGGTLTFVGMWVCFLGLVFSPATPQNEGLRLSLLMGASFLKGCSLGPLLQLAADVDPSLISSAVVATSAVFAAFTGAAFFAKRREYLYLGGLCGSALSMLLATRLASYLFGTHVLQFQLELYAGLFIFAGYIVFDTQVMIERAALGSKDYISDALQLLLDFVAIFVRILIILMKNRDGRKEEDERRKNKRR